MFSVTPSEMLTIAVIALIVFGPARLAEMARKAGKLVGELRQTSSELKEGLKKELDEVAGPFREAGTQLAATGKELRETAEGQLVWVDKKEPAPTEPAPGRPSSQEQDAESTEGEDEPTGTSEVS